MSWNHIILLIIQLDSKTSGKSEWFFFLLGTLHVSSYLLLPQTFSLFSNFFFPLLTVNIIAADQLLTINFKDKAEHN